ncbi:MAG TPA: peptidoglycan-associated lipoprotein Pal [Terriglobales bacterium]|nr:peptidoglycan-associated lipoprotein Pal [Terriglobales bacterium]
MRRSVRASLVLLVAGLALFAAGCAKKATEAPPTPPPAPPVTQQPTTPPPTTPPTPPETVAPRFSQGDLSDAFFDFDSYALREDAKAALDKDAKALRDNKDANITIEGHCDERGTVEYNIALGEKRAGAARDYLVNAGVNASHIQTVSYGKERPFAEGHDESAWAQNRRAHFVLR